MKKIISLCLAVGILLCLTGCVSQKEADALSDRITALEAQLSSAQKELSDAKKELTNAKDQIQQLQQDKNGLNAELAEKEQTIVDMQLTVESLQTQLDSALAEVDELKNGPDRALAAIRTAYEAKNWKEVISLANALHAKYPGMNQDQEAQELAASAQKTLDDEKAKAEAEAAKTLEEKVHGLIRITKLSCSRPNSAGGVGIDLHFVNMHPEKTIKYLEVSVYPYNAVGDMMDCDIRGYSRYTCEATGPYAPGQGLNAYTGWWWPNAWYNWNISYIELSGVRIRYTDGTSVSLSSKELPYAIW